jgi:cellobiose phosphorylase
VGKGIYDVDAFEAALGNRFPENRILSHDLLEGCHARSGLINDVELYEEYPLSYLADMKRRHRWIRGDWQIARWIWRDVPSPENRSQPNVISTLSKWKIADNLRRSLVAPALLMMLLIGWFISASPWFWTISMVGILLPPPLLVLLYNLAHKPREVERASHVRTSIDQCINQLLQLTWSVITLPYEAMQNLDAIGRTIWRIYISKKNLLQWNPAHQVKNTTSLRAHIQSMWTAPAIAILVLLGITYLSPLSLIVVAPFALVWIASPALAWWISLPQLHEPSALSVAQHRYLRTLARKTWAYFEQFVGPEHHWLPPDNFQEYPAPRIANRTSPTNIGLSLLSTLSAYDFGYITMSKLLMRCGNMIGTLTKLDRYKGHLFNWYETTTLNPLFPRYISTVDSGNLAGCLLTLKEGLEEIRHSPLIHANAIDGLTDSIHILRDHVKGSPWENHVRDMQHRIEQLPNVSTHMIRHIIQQTIREVQDLKAILATPNEMAGWWIDNILFQCSDLLDELDLLFVDYHDKGLPESITSILKEIRDNPACSEVLALCEECRQRLTNLSNNATDDEQQELFTGWLQHITATITTLKDRFQQIKTIKANCIDLSTYEYDFLFDKTRHFLSIGYNLEDHRRDTGYYDLLGSEARLGVYIAISQGKIPQESWFTLGRQLTQAGTAPALISWSGSMFEYLMPMLLLPTYDNTLLDQTHKGAVRRQIDYGEKRNLPWGISESGFNMFHANMDYQYRAFGVPGLGLKRGLGDDYVVAPYASVLALMVDAQAAIDNLRRLGEDGLEGHWGMYEAIDYTPARLQRGQQAMIVKAFMTHHQGMSMLAIANVLHHQRMQSRFQSDVQLKTSLLLLQEKIPQVSTFYTPVMDVGDIPSDSMLAELRIIRNTQTPIPEVQLLSNGRYHVMVSNTGGGYSRWKDMAVTRWREDGTKDDWGTYCFIRDLESGNVWSNAYQPTRKKPDHYEVIFSQGRAEYRSNFENIDTHTEIVVSPEDDIELRRVHITNRSRKKRWIAVTSYAEVVLNQDIAEILHPAFSNLFIQSKIIDHQHAILCTRRPRSVDEHPPSMFHLMNVHGGEDHQVTYETNRDAFIGRSNTVHAPDAVLRDALENNEGSVLDPVVAIQYKIRLRPYETITVDMLYGMADTSEACHELIAKYQDRHMADRTLELAWTHIQVILRQINASAADASLFCKMAGSIIYANPAMRADPSVILRNQRGQSGLWSHSISGDWPIVLLQIEDNTHIDMVQKLVQAHAFWRLKGLTVDLVIWNEDHGGYRQLLHNQIQSLITPILSIEEQNKPGGIFVRSADQLSNEDRVLFQTVARMIISDKMGPLEEQLNRRKQIRQALPQLPVTRFAPYPATGLEPETDLLFFNGYGGFTKEGTEYVINALPGQPTPAPWSNVIANPHFGTVLTESGQSYTWFQNAHELRLTPWHNDPVTDRSGEHYYIRDDETGRYWSPSPLPARGKTPYIVRHGFGYSTFEHLEDGLHSTFTVFVDPDKPVKYCVIKVRNVSDRHRILSVFGYIEWVLGDLRHKTHMHIISELDLQHGAILVRNSYQTEFGQLVAFYDVNETARTITADRAEFIGRNGTFASPDAMQKAKLSGRIGAGLDPCAALQVQMTLPEGEEHELVFRMGTGMHINDVSYLVRETRATAREALKEVKRRWHEIMGNVMVICPDPAIQLMANGWLTYQTLSCRMWARSGYYQSGGAFGFRDQLQDVLSLLYTQPALAKAQILLHASRQFVKGDVQHWWHPPVGRGVRTKCSDDYLWLPYVLAKYVSVTGDDAILNEEIYFLESRDLTHEEHSVYDLPARSDQHATLYEHAIRALEYGFRVGPHGIPLIGAGDWNDGMDRVGTEGRGESIWLGWFLYETIQRFTEIVESKKDILRRERFMQMAAALREALDTHGWDGEWYKRAYFDDGTPLGAKENAECRIDSIAQSWSVISGAGDAGKARMAMANAAEHLVNHQQKIIKLFEPPFDKSALNPGYIKGYVPGVRENGGQYTHAAIWMIMAFAILKDREKMWELLQLINPVNHGRTKEDIHTYKVEPYVVAADVYAVAGQSGRGGWTWYTGSAGWMYQLIIEYVFGLRRKRDVLFIEPCLPPGWDNVSIQYRYGQSVYSIDILQEQHGEEAHEFILDGEIQDASYIRLVDDAKEHRVEVKLAQQVVSENQQR